eukprot:CAMPEP_0115041810 /NCGR_PEP_ID=MMETSP0216-20121206/45854_1 /TAXON_ID=223996 /ORGANISM="Protocruzia adherens, Strain Boccale" /LENGTH=47 /DNA_ID= /DNA_START= /DNA_END= /DNA_ORIENTATION=
MNYPKRYDYAVWIWRPMQNYLISDKKYQQLYENFIQSGIHLKKRYLR